MILYGKAPLISMHPKAGNVIGTAGWEKVKARVELVPGKVLPDLLPGITSLFSRTTTATKEISINRTVFTDEKGRFRIENAEPGIYTLRITHPEYKEGLLPGVTVDRKDLNRAGTAVIEQGGTLTCTVYGPDGKVLPGRLVSVTGMDSKSYSLIRTNEKGRFRMVHLAAGRYELSLPGAEGIPLGDMSHPAPPRSNKLGVVIVEGEETQVDFYTH